MRSTTRPRGIPAGLCFNRGIKESPENSGLDVIRGVADVGWGAVFRSLASFAPDPTVETQKLHLISRGLSS